MQALIWPAGILVTMDRVGLVVNPIAGMGGRVGLKGTDGVLEEALERGAEPAAGHRASLMLKRFLSACEGLPGAPQVVWVTSSGPMGADALEEAGVPAGSIEVVHEAPDPATTTAEDTIAACRSVEEAGVKVLLFCGGDGTARDVLRAVDQRVPVLGVPAGVKMHSGVFAVTPSGAADTLLDFLQGRLDVAEADVIDLDEDLYREGEWNLKMFGTASTPYEPSLIQGGKVMVSEASEQGLLEDIAECIEEYIEEEPDTLWLLGPGGTLRFIGEWLKIDKTLLGVDAVVAGEQVGKDLNEAGILELMERYERAKIVVSPIGAQGFFLGRGNLQLSPDVVRRVGVRGFDVVSTPAKLARTPMLRVDTGDAEVNGMFREKGHMGVLIGYKTRKLIPVQ
jgi:predicted polyphosphate/ATP-dependent NAD kinase